MKILEKFMKENPPVWYRRLFPWLPICYRNTSLRLFTFMLFDCSVTSKSLTKKHFLNVLIMNHRNKWYHPKYIGFKIWY